MTVPLNTIVNKVAFFVSSIKENNDVEFLKAHFISFILFPYVIKIAAYRRCKGSVPRIMTPQPH